MGYLFFKTLFRIFYTLLFRYSFSGHENIPAEGGVIIAANHLSLLDPPLVGICMKRRATYMAKRGLFSLPLIGRFVTAFSFPVDRENPRPSTIKEAVRRLKKGEVIVMFPEGTRGGVGDSSAGKRGVASIASMAGARVVPALIEGTDRALPQGARFVRLRKVRVTFGRPLSCGEHESAKECQDRIATDIMKEIHLLKGSNT